MLGAGYTRGADEQVRVRNRRRTAAADGHLRDLRWRRGAGARQPRLRAPARPRRRATPRRDLGRDADLPVGAARDAGSRDRWRRDRRTGQLPRLGGRIPVNPSGGLACFGEAVPAQALAQVCELVWQLRSQAGARQVAGARAGITCNQGLFGHGSAVIVTR